VVPGTRITSYGEDIAVVTVTRSAAPVDRLLGSLPVALDRAYRIVVAHSGAGPGPAVPDGVDLLVLGEDVGRAAAANRAIAGLDRSVGWVVLSDPGVAWAAGAVEGLLAAARPRAAALGPLLRDPAGRVLPSGGALPTLRDALCGRPAGSPPAGPVGWVPASAVLLRRAALDSVDGFDPRYVGEWDDVDLGERLGRAGWLVLHVPGAEAVVHPTGGPGMLEPRGVAVRRYLHDRRAAPARALLVLAGRGRR
jgi:N-acetylglucosaminyl-diphospho-decaprenol L-rhamnosyltransferase